MPQSKRSPKRRKSVEKAKVRSGHKPDPSPNHCKFPEFYETDRCCMCGDYITTCPCTFSEALNHSQKFHQLSEMDASRAQFTAKMNDPTEIIHAEAQNNLGATICGIDVDFGMIVASHPSMANCPGCKS